jgi:hypothetical protein
VAEQRGDHKERHSVLRQPAREGPAQVVRRHERDGIDRAAARDRRIATDWILRVLEDAMAESHAKAAKSGK